MNETPQHKILLVDDEADNLTALERTLRNRFQLETCQSPKQAIEKIREKKYSVVVSDQRMPEMTGVEFLAEVSKIQPLATRVILTAHTETGELLEAINRAEIYRYVVKPWDNDELQTIMLKAVEHFQLKVQNHELIQNLERRNEALAQKEKQLRELNQSLEALVERRTSELKQANEKLSELAMTDPLTNVLNRRAFFAKFEEEIVRSSRYRHPISVAMLDVDHFKAFNDMEGHLFGDEALCKIARVIQRNIRQIDFLCRYGGEEFSLVMPETQTVVGVEICERLRAAIERTTFQGKSGTAYLTISVGICGFPQDGKSTRELIDSADQALYSAKRLGRNRVIGYDANSMSIRSE